MQKNETKERNEGRVRLLRMLELLWTQSDHDHPISTSEFIRLLNEKWGIEAHRVTVQRDIEALLAAGFDICAAARYLVGSAEKYKFHKDSSPRFICFN